MRDLETIVPTGNSIPHTAEILVVIVLFKMRPAESASVRSLLESLDKVGARNFKVLLWDNTPGGQDPGQIPFGLEYHAAPDNPGIAPAYNTAIEFARSQEIRWLLTLDQDTKLPLDFVSVVTQLALNLAWTPGICAVVPQVIGDGRNLSPFRFVFGFIPRSLPSGCIGLLEHGTYALNSGAMVRVDVLAEVGGYDPLFPLDVSDINLFHKLSKSAKRVYVAGNLIVAHEFSVLKRHQRMSLDRYRTQLRDECAFWDLNMSSLARAERVLRLVVRALKDSVVPEARSFSRVAIFEILRRAITPRNKRIAQWKTWAEERARRGGAKQRATEMPVPDFFNFRGSE